MLKAAGYRTDHIGKWHIWAHKAGGHHGAENNYVPPGPYRLGFDDFWAAYNFGHNNFNYSYWTDSPKEIRAKEFKPLHFTNLAIHDEFNPCSWYRDHWTDDRVIMRSGPGEFKRELGESIEVDTSYGKIRKGGGST